jgi:hypothetical protein
MSVVEQKKERIRVALEELDFPTSISRTSDAMRILNDIWMSGSFEEMDGSIGDFVGDDDFKEEIFSARVIQAVMDVVQDKYSYSSPFYGSACCVLYFLCYKNTELATAFVASSGVEFLLETLEDFTSDQPLLLACFAVHRAVIESLDGSEREYFAGMTLETLLDVAELNFDSADEQFYQYYCVAVLNSFRPGLDLKVNRRCYHRTVYFVWRGLFKHECDDKIQVRGHALLCYLVGKERAKKMIDNAAMYYCDDEECFDAAWTYRYAA